MEEFTISDPSSGNLFDRLPAELRNKIYELALVRRKSIAVLRRWSTNADVIRQRMKVRVRQPALTRVNRKIRSESLPIFYGMNIFVVHGVASTEVLEWLKLLPKAERCLIKQMYIPDGYRYAWINELAEALGPREFEITSASGEAPKGALCRGSKGLKLTFR